VTLQLSYLAVTLRQIRGEPTLQRTVYKLNFSKVLSNYDCQPLTPGSVLEILSQKHPTDVITSCPRDFIIERHFTTPPQCKWGLCSSGMLRRVYWWLVTDVSWTP